MREKRTEVEVDLPYALKCYFFKFIIWIITGCENNKTHNEKLLVENSTI